MAQYYFREFRDLSSDHENFPHENLVLLWACHVLCAHANRKRDHAYVHACDTTSQLMNV